MKNRSTTALAACLLLTGLLPRPARATDSRIWHTDLGETSRSRKMWMIAKELPVHAGELISIDSETLLSRPPSYCPVEQKGGCFVYSLAVTIAERDTGQKRKVWDLVTGTFKTSREAELWLKTVDNALKYKGKALHFGQAYVTYAGLSTGAPGYQVNFVGPVTPKGTDLRSVNLLTRLALMGRWGGLSEDEEGREIIETGLSQPTAENGFFAPIAERVNEVVVVANPPRPVVPKKASAEENRGFWGTLFAGKHGGATGAGNGGGGDRTDTTGWIPIGIGNLFSRPGAKVTISPNWNMYFDRSPGLLSVCRERPYTAFFALSPKVALEIEIQDSAGKPLTMETVCGNPKLLEAYQSLATTLRSIEDHPVFLHVTKAIRALSGQSGGPPVVVQLHEKRRKFKERGGEIEEYSWFDRETGTIGWAPRKESEGFLEGILSRCERGVFMHELGHVLTHRLYGGYPKLEYWHDARQALRPRYRSAKDYEVPTATLYRFETSVEAAFIEAFSNMLEAPFTFSHPMVEDSPFSNFVGGETYWDERFYFDSRQLLSSEPLLSTMLHEFVRRPQGYSKQRDAVVVNGDQDALVRLIDALLATGKRYDFVEWMRTYDKADPQVRDEAWRLVREYLLYDIKENRSIVKDFGFRKGSDGKGFGTTNAKAPEGSFYSYYAWNSREAVLKRDDAGRAAAVSPEELMRMLARLGARAEARLEAFEKERKVFRATLDAFVRQNRAAGARDDAAERLQTSLGLNMSVAWMSIEEFLKAVLGAKDPVQAFEAKYLEGFRALKARTDALVADTSSGSAESHFKRYEELWTLRGRLKHDTRELEQIELLMKAWREGGAKR